MANIMVIDDNEELQEVLTDFLEADSHQVFSAGDGATAKAQLRDCRPEVVLLDIGLPDATGLELLPYIKSLHPGVCVIVITGINDYRIEDLLYEAGADHFVSKPFRGQDLVARVRSVLEAPTAAPSL